MTRTSTYKPGLAWFAALGSAWVFVLVALGAFTTSIGAGMAFADWPLSNGSVNPHGWLTEIDKFAEHSHRLSATMMGLDHDHSAHLAAFDRSSVSGCANSAGGLWGLFYFKACSAARA